MALKVLDPLYYIEERFMPRGKGGGSAPAAPDPAVTAAAQTATNKETAYWNATLNNVNQYTPYGSLTYNEIDRTPEYDEDAYTQALSDYKDGGSWTALDGRTSTSDPTTRRYIFDKNYKKPPQFESTVNLSPEQQALYDTQTRSQQGLATLGENQIGRITDSVSSPYSYGGIGNEFSAEDAATQQANAESAYMARLNPQFAQDEEALRTRLINQGIGQGSQAYQREMDSFGQMKNDARSQAVLAGQQYGSNAQQQALQRRNQGISEYDAQRNAPLNEYIGLTSGVQVQNPQFSSQGYQGAQTTDYAGLVNQNYQNQMAQYNAQQAGSNNTMGSLFGLGGSFLGAAGQAGGIGALFSDARLKENIELVGEENGYPTYKFNYINIPEKTYIGVMAQDVEKIRPEAVIESEGFKKVNYDMIGVKMREESHAE